MKVWSAFSFLILSLAGNYNHPTASIKYITKRIRCNPTGWVFRNQINGSNGWLHVSRHGLRHELRDTYVYPNNVDRHL